jgi:hypothetical protein
MKLAVTFVTGVILLMSGNGCTFQHLPKFVGLKNGAVLHGEVKLPIEVPAGDLDGIFMVANGGPIPCGGQIQTNSAGHWFVDWNTQNVPNGIYDIYLEADLGDKRFLSTTQSITVSNMISFNAFPMFGTRVWVFGRLAVPRADWTVKVFNAADKYIGYFVGTTTNGFINFVWDLEDTNGGKYPDESFRSEYTITPLNNFTPAIPREHPNLQTPSTPSPEKTPRKLIPAEQK